MHCAAGSVLFRSYKFDLHSSSHQLRCSLKRLDRHVASVGIEHSINLRPAGVHLLRELVLAQLALAHRLGELPRDDLLNGLRLKRLENAFLREKIIER